MGKVLWNRKEELLAQGKISPLYPTTVAPSRNEYKQPERYEDDWITFLLTDNANNYWFKQIKNWYTEKDKPDKESAWVRARQTPIQWKSAIGNADMKTNFETSKLWPIHRGDIMIRQDGVIFMLDWQVQVGPIDYNSQTIECNTYFEFKREQNNLTDEDGILIEERPPKIVIPKIPGVCAEYTGRPDFEVSQGTVGITSGDLLTCYVQWNPTTRGLRIGDLFEFGDYQYRVENVSIERVNIHREYGEIMFHARRVVGGALYG